jgi:chemotaxis protein CheD
MDASPALIDLSTTTHRVIVGVGGLAVSTNRSERLATYSLGSCLGITIHDPVTRVSGMLHSMLPDSSLNPAKAAQQPGMFIDSGIPALFRAAYKLGLDKSRAEICVAGGAQIMDTGGLFNIGQRNFDRLIDLLEQHGLAIKAAEVGGRVSRTIQMNVANGEVHLKTSGQSAETILMKGQ